MEEFRGGNIEYIGSPLSVYQGSYTITFWHWSDGLQPSDRDLLRSIQ